MFVDIHVHCAYAREGLARPNGSRYPDPDELIGMMDRYGIDKAIIQSTISPEFRYLFLTPDETADICAAHPDRFIFFLNIDPRMVSNNEKSDFRPLIEYYLKRGAKGVGEYTPNIPFDDPRNMRFFAQVEEMGLPLTFHVGPTQFGCYGCYDEVGLPRLETVLQSFPKLTFLAHSQPFWAEISADVTQETRQGYPKGKVTPGRVVELLRKYPNLHGDLSANSGYNAVSRDPEFGCAFMEEFQDRLYFGTDIANVAQECPLPGYFAQLREKGLVSTEALDKIAWKNANRLLDLGMAE